MRRQREHESLPSVWSLLFQVRRHPPKGLVRLVHGRVLDCCSVSAGGYGASSSPSGYLLADDPVHRGTTSYPLDKRTSQNCTSANAS